MEVEYDTSETSFRKFMALGVIQSILGNRVTTFFTKDSNTAA